MVVERLALAKSAGGNARGIIGKDLRRAHTTRKWNGIHVARIVPWRYNHTKEKIRDKACHILEALSESSEPELSKMEYVHFSLCKMVGKTQSGLIYRSLPARLVHGQHNTRIHPKNLNVIRKRCGFGDLESGGLDVL